MRSWLTLRIRTKADARERLSLSRFGGGLGWGLCHDAKQQGQARKDFFFEKKKQKTFVSLGFGLSG
jgi:hypothetical protein